MGYLNRIAASTDVTRRTFVAAASATAALAAVALAGCNGEVTPDPDPEPVVHRPDERDLVTGEWKLGACWHNCGGRCSNRVLVRDGVIIRQATDNFGDDSYDDYQRRSCVRGHSQRMQTAGADRLRYPMKRKHWQPGGIVDSGWLRGRDEWERISWDDAIKYIMVEAKRVYDKWGSDVLLSFSNGSSSNIGGQFFRRKYGWWGTQSYGSWYRTQGLIGMQLGWPSTDMNDRYDWKNCEQIVFLGANPAWSSGGSYLWMGYQSIVVRGEGRIKTYFVDPFYSETAAFFANFGGKWIQCRPSMDMPLYLAIAYEMWRLDQANGRGSYIDWDFLDNKTIGFDAEHMPATAGDSNYEVDPTDNFLDYLKGTKDGVVKNAEWASKLSGTKVEDIKLLADVMSKKYKTAIVSGWAPARTRNSDNISQMVMTLGAMGGHFGKSGHMTGVCCHQFAFSGGQSMLGSIGSAGIKTAPSAGSTSTISSLSQSEMWKAIAQGQYTEASSLTNAQCGTKKAINIKMIVSDSGAYAQTVEGQPFMIQAMRNAEFVVAHGQFETTNCRYADIVLPVTTKWEEDGGTSSSDSNETVNPGCKVVEPKYEAKSETNISWAYAKYRGADCSSKDMVSNEQGWFNCVKGAKWRDVDANTTKTLITIDEDTLKQLKVYGEAYATNADGTPYTQEGKYTYDEFLKRGVITTPRHEGDRYVKIANESFATGTGTKSTQSRKMEIYCGRLYERINKQGYSHLEPIPTYIPPVEGYEDTFSDFANGVKGEFPFQLYNPHYWRRSHTVFDNILWMREAWPNPFFVNAQDAEAKGVKDGDVILLISPHGRSIRHAAVTNRIMPGVVAVPHGAWLDVNEGTGIDVAGSDNWIGGAVPTGQGTSGYNTGICNWEKYDGELVADCFKPQRNHHFEA